MIGIILQITQTGTGVADTLNKAGAAMTPPVEQSISLWEMAVKGGPILFPIAILSIAVFYFFFERYFTIRRFSKVESNFMNQIRDYVHSGNIEAAKSLCRNTNTPVARMIEKGLLRLGKPVKEIEAAIENVGKLEVFQMEKNMNILNSISGIAPMFGFLGTIFGVIKIFYQIAQQNSLEINTISGGLYVKMISSASGLLVGMIAYAAYHYLTFMIDRVVNRMEVNAVEFIDLLEEPVKG
jgi:biopolymer transport protein ExbB